MERVIVKLQEYCGRMGSVSSIFVCTKEELESLYGREVYFGEILGKHSEIIVKLTKNNLTVLSDEQDFVDKFVSIMGNGTISGHNPLDYLEDEVDDENE
jgi:hypothetical protein